MKSTLITVLMALGSQRAAVANQALPQPQSLTHGGSGRRTANSISTSPTQSTPNTE